MVFGFFFFCIFLVIVLYIPDFLKINECSLSLCCEPTNQYYENSAVICEGYLAVMQLP